MAVGSRRPIPHNCHNHKQTQERHKPQCRGARLLGGTVGRCVPAAAAAAPIAAAAAAGVAAPATASATAVPTPCNESAAGISRRQRHALLPKQLRHCLVHGLQQLRDGQHDIQAHCEPVPQAVLHQSGVGQVAALALLKHHDLRGQQGCMAPAGQLVDTRLCDRPAGALGKCSCCTALGIPPNSCEAAPLPHGLPYTRQQRQQQRPLPLTFCSADSPCHSG